MRKKNAAVFSISASDNTYLMLLCCFLINLIICCLSVKYQQHHGEGKIASSAPPNPPHPQICIQTLSNLGANSEHGIKKPPTS